jgi:hypothetical protein
MWYSIYSYYTILYYTIKTYNIDNHYTYNKHTTTLPEQPRQTRNKFLVIVGIIVLYTIQYTIQNINIYNSKKRSRDNENNSPEKKRKRKE